MHKKRIKRYSCLLNNGKKIIRERIIKNNKDGSAAIILPITKEGNVLLVVQPRVFKPTTVGVEVPAGYIEDDEDPILSAKRELEEETGYACRDMILLAKYFQDSGCSSAYNHCFLALDCEKVTEQHLDKDEFVRYFECSFEEALELIDLGYIKFDKEKGKISGIVNSVVFKGVHYEIIVDIGGFKWMIQTTDFVGEGSKIGLYIEPDAIHVLNKSEYSGKFGDYSSFSDELDALSNPNASDEV